MAEDADRVRRRATRMDTVASLSRTVQHDINNLLTVVFANLEMLKRTAAEGAPQRQLDRIQEASRRFEATTRTLLSFMRRPAGEVLVVRLSEVVGALQPLLFMILPAPGALAVDLAAEDWPVRIERSALEEALLALVQQVAEAQVRGTPLSLSIANEGDQVRLRIVLPPMPPPPALAVLTRWARAGGCGIDETPGALALLVPRHVDAVAPA